MSTSYLLLMIVSTLGDTPALPRDNPVTVAAQATVATMAHASEAWVMDYGLTLDDCNAALAHLPKEDRPMPLDGSAATEAMAFVAFACDLEDAE